MTSETDADKLRRRNAELSILNSIAQALNRSVDLDEAVQTALERVADMLGLHTGWVWLLQEKNGRAYLAAAQNLPPALADQPQKMAGNCYCLDTYRQEDLAGAANINVVTCSRLKDLVDGTDGLRYHATVPLYAHGKKLGVLNVASPDWQQLSAADLQLLYTIGDLLGIAVERARLFEQQAELGALSERNRLAREIHDTLAQGLTAVSLQLESADALLETEVDPERVRQAVQHALALTRANLEEARRSVLDLRAAPLADKTLVDALVALAEKAVVPVDLLVVGQERPLARRIESGIYRIAQEALNNVSRHSQAASAAVTVTYGASEIRLAVHDDGVGFNPDAVPPNHFGLTGMNERVKLLDGTLRLESSPSAGTRIEVKIHL
ncbi:MAG: GAF domain-containing sensor histidine kinase [Chloroflexi bacterium]|nr:GAF domain-containing sensor histidine kinase [Chloroflexota bacterium]